MRVLVLGGTGAIGSHLCRKLASAGTEVVCTTRTPHNSSEYQTLTYITGNAKNKDFLQSLLHENWDAIVDFMSWFTDEFRDNYESILSSTSQYVFTSSYRVYAESPVIHEDSPRLLDVVDNSKYLATDEYALRKARCENMLFSLSENNWTVVRPAVTYDGITGRLQFGVLEQGEWLWRAINGVPVPMPTEMLRKQATMSFAGDVAEMIARLIGKPEALGETFTVSGSDHITWLEVVQAYSSILPFNLCECSADKFISARGREYQLRFDRMFNRVVDNSKILKVTEVDSSTLTPMTDGLKRELKCFLNGDKKPDFRPATYGKYDKLCGGMPSLKHVIRDGGAVDLAKYLIRRWL